jgi:hypothetical protein
LRGHRLVSRLDLLDGDDPLELDAGSFACDLDRLE